MEVALSLIDFPWMLYPNRCHQSTWAWHLSARHSSRNSTLRKYPQHVCASAAGRLSKRNAFVALACFHTRGERMAANSCMRRIYPRSCGYDGRAWPARGFSAKRSDLRFTTLRNYVEGCFHFSLWRLLFFLFSFRALFLPVLLVSFTRLCEEQSRSCSSTRLAIPAGYWVLRSYVASSRETCCID